MYTSFLDNEVRQIVTDEFKKKNYHQNYRVVTVKSEKHREELDGNSVYILASDTVDVQVEAKIVMYSEDNFLISSKTEFENDAEHKIEKFRGYIEIETKNQSSFTPYKLKFLKITPY